MNIDELDIKVLKENYDIDEIKNIDINNVSKINKYLEENGVYYSKDLFLSNLDLFLLPCDIFIKKFEMLKQKLGDNFVDKLGEYSSLIELMYED